MGIILSVKMVGRGLSLHQMCILQKKKRYYCCGRKYNNIFDHDDGYWAGIMFSAGVVLRVAHGVVCRWGCVSMGLCVGGLRVRFPPSKVLALGMVYSSWGTHLRPPRDTPIGVVLSLMKSYLLLLTILIPSVNSMLSRPSQFLPGRMSRKVWIRMMVLTWVPHAVLWASSSLELHNKNEDEP